MKGFLLATAIFLVFLSMAQFGVIQDPTAPPVQWTTVAEGVNSRITRPERVILTSQADWQSYYSRMAGGPGHTAPTLCDFALHDLIVIHAGTRKTDGHRIYVSTISRPAAHTKQVEFYDVYPPNGVTMRAMTQNPYVIIRVNKATGNYTFVGRQVQMMPQVLVGSCCACGCPFCGKGATAVNSPLVRSGELFPPLDGGETR